MPRRILEGEVVSNKTDKTVTVKVERRFMHPIYKKFIKKSDKFTAHDPENVYNAGDRISIIECAPISKTKRWMVMIDGKPAMDGLSPQSKAGKPAAPKKAAAPKAEKTEKPAVKKAAAPKTAKKKDA
ncbi:MAG: 30S ribosomal protein S17 [Micavibrio sp.]|nr:30S ribosomal protein S17 [Micavibrio sp.]